MKSIHGFFFVGATTCYLLILSFIHFLGSKMLPLLLFLVPFWFPLWATSTCPTHPNRESFTAVCAMRLPCHTRLIAHDIRILSSCTLSARALSANALNARAFSSTSAMRLWWNRKPDLKSPKNPILTGATGATVAEALNTPQSSRGSTSDEFGGNPVEPTIHEMQMNQLLGRTLNRTTSNAIRCTLINKDGRIQINHGEFKRADLVTRFGLLPRDLRKLDVSTHNIVPAILVRDSSIVVNLLHIRAIIKANCVLLVDVTLGDSEATRIQSLFLYDLEHRLRMAQGLSMLPYEQRALETILISVVTTLTTEFQSHEQRVLHVLQELEIGLDRERLQKLLVQSKNLSGFVQKASLIRDELEELIDNDRDIAGLYLSTPAPVDDSDVEVMLESYYSQCDEVVQSAEHLSGNIKSTEEYINILLDSNRNSLMMLEVRFQVGMLGLGAGSLLAALYGMNLRNMIEDSTIGFVAVCSCVGVIALATVVIGLRKLATIGKIKNNEMKRRF